MVKLNKKVFIFIALVLGVVMLISGFDFFDEIYYKLNPNANEYGRFVRVGNMHIARPSSHKAVLLDDGRVLILSGHDNAEIYDPEKRKFKLVEKYSERTAITATLLKNGMVLLTGLADHADLFDPETEKFIPTGKMNYPRYEHTATLLKDGRVLIIGGEALRSLKGKVLLKERKFYEYSEIYDPKTGKFELGPKIINKRGKHSSILLDDGNILVVGGGNNEEWLKEAEIYDVKANKFIEIGNIKSSFKIKPQMIKLKNGDILIFYA